MIIIYDRLLETINTFVAVCNLDGNHKNYGSYLIKPVNWRQSIQITKTLLCSNIITLHHCGLLIKQKVTVLYEPFPYLMCGSNNFRGLLYQDICTAAACYHGMKASNC